MTKLKAIVHVNIQALLSEMQNRPLNQFDIRLHAHSPAIVRKIKINMFALPSGELVS